MNNLFGLSIRSIYFNKGIEHKIFLDEKSELRHALTLSHCYLEMLLLQLFRLRFPLLPILLALPLVAVSQKPAEARIDPECVSMAQKFGLNSRTWRVTSDDGRCVDIDYAEGESGKIIPVRKFERKTLPNLFEVNLQNPGIENATIHSSFKNGAAEYTNWRILFLADWHIQLEDFGRNRRLVKTQVGIFVNPEKTELLVGGRFEGGKFSRVNGKKFNFTSIRNILFASDTQVWYETPSGEFEYIFIRNADLTGCEACLWSVAMDVERGKLTPTQIEHFLAAIQNKQRVISPTAPQIKTPINSNYQLTEKERTIESLPDGVYYYKENGAGRFKTYFLFRKRANKVIGEIFGGGGSVCFAGSSDRNAITNNVISYQGSKAGWSFGKEDRYDLNNFSKLELSLYPERLGSPSEAIQRCEKTLAHLLNQNSSVEITKPEVIQDTFLGSDSDRTNPPAPPTSTARPPNSQELAILDRQPKVQTTDRTQIKNRTNNFLKPFAGGWQTADNQKYYVYPSTKKERQACIIVENGSAQDLQIGVANGNATGTDINVGTSRLFKTANDNTIALRLPNSQSLVPLYASAIEANITPGNLEMMQQVGCITSFTGVAKGGPIAAKPIVEPKPSTPVKPSGAICPERMFAATVPPRKEYDNQSPSYAFLETSGRFKDGIGVDVDPKNIENTKKGSRKILADTRCNYFKELNNISNPQRTWLIIHGWDNNVDESNSATPAVADVIANALKEKYPNDRVLALDWSEASSNQGNALKVGDFSLNYRGVYYAATWIRPIAEATVQKLRDKYGIDDLNAISNLNIVGHSLGSLMAAEIGSLYTSGVNSIIALDPASEIIIKGDLYSQLGGYDVDGRTPAYKQVSLIQRFFSTASQGRIPGRDFIPGNVDRPKCFGNGDNLTVKISECDSSRRVARFTRSFVGGKSIAGNQGFAASADESFQINFSNFNPINEHGDVTKVFANIVSQSYFEGFIGLQDLNFHANIKRGSDGHSGIIQVDSSNTPTRILLDHEKKGSLVIRPDSKVYYRHLLDKIIDWKESDEADSINILFPEK